MISNMENCNLTMYLFEGILNGDSVKKSKGVAAVMKYVFGDDQFDLAITTGEEHLQDKVERELDKSILQNRVLLCRLKESLESLSGENPLGEFSGPVSIWVVDNQTLVITCQWTDGLIQNERYVVGVIGDTNVFNN